MSSSGSTRPPRTSCPVSTPADKRKRLERISYQDSLLGPARLAPETLPFFAGMGFRNNMSMHTSPAWKAAQYSAPGFAGLGLQEELAFDEASYTFHFTDGGATIARLLVDRLVPAAIPGGPHDMQTITLARLDYPRLDVPAAPVRLRRRGSCASFTTARPSPRAR